MKENGKQARNAFIENGFVFVENLLEAKIWERITNISNVVEMERVTEGDAGDKHTLYVGRLLKAPAGVAPTAVSPYTEEIVSYLQMPNIVNFLQGLMQTNAPLYCRRGQYNILPAGAFIGEHIDRDADPDYEAVLILHLNSVYEGGEYIIQTPKGEEVALKPPPFSFLICRTDINHWVHPVTKGERKTLIMFISQYNGKNRKI